MIRGMVVLAVLLVGPAGAQEPIVSARYVDVTMEYGHGALPDGAFSGLEVTTARSNHRVRLDGQVFEDTAPRLVDLDGDGAPEVVTVVSVFDKGARVQIWGLGEAGLTPLASNRPIGTRHRWLAISGIADLDGDGCMEIAYVDRPHLARVLRVIRVWHDADDAWRIAQVDSAAGHTNHRYGAPDIEGGIFDCGQGPEVVTANAEWRRVMGTRLVAGRLQSRDLGPYSGAQSLRCD